ncbi:MAG: ABC transporter ATP-binding protein [Oscillospiraceae bacterium]|nr:ABC transporter ATP-binding protein [Oscillospiraceae bacterium]
MDNDNKIVIEHVNKFYSKKQALFDINLTINQGMFGLLGRNGAGKTTLMKTLATLHCKRDGKITICGIPVENAKEIRSIIGYLPQEFSMYPSMTVRESLEYLGVLSEMPKEAIKQRTQMLIKRVNLTEHQDKKVKALSGGMKRRLGIAQALLHDPKVLIVDEPTAGLDPEERIRFRNLLCEVAEERIVILSTHIVGDIEATCEDIAIMNEGKILYNGTVSDLMKSAQGKVYTLAINKNQLAEVKKNYIVTGMLVASDVTSVRVISDKVPEKYEAQSVSPNVEDSYMYCLYANGCDVLGGEQ